MRKSIYYLFTVVLAGLVVAVGMPQKASAAGTAKNVILIIGDGMGPQQVGLLLTYARQAPNSVLKNRVTAFDRMMEKGIMGISMHYANGVLVTDSAASATQLASGVAAGSEMIGVDKDGNPTFTILERAKKAGKSTGLVSDTRVTHATPAAFAAHQTHRSHENAIAVDMVKRRARCDVGRRAAVG